MNVRNLLAPGDFILTVPVGVNITVQYDENGIIQKLLGGLDPQGVELPDELLHAVIPSGVVPTSLTIKQGTTWVSGVFTHSGPMSLKSGELPDGVLDDMSADLLERPSMFTFYATAVTSNALQFSGGVASQRWLSSAGFNVLPNFVVPAHMTDAQLTKLMSSAEFIVAGLLVLHNFQWQYMSFNLRQDAVVSVTKQFDDIGRLRGTILTANNERFDVDYYDIVNFNIQRNTLVIHDDYHVVSVFQGDSKKRDSRPATFPCPTCGAMINVVGPDTVCSNVACPSRCYDDVLHFLSGLNLPVLPRARYLDAFKGCSAVTLSSVLELPEYESQVVDVTPAQLLRAAIPVTVVRADAPIAELCQMCNNEVRSILYHLKHIDRLHIDLAMDESSAAAWAPLQNYPELITDIESLLHHPNIQLTIQDRKFDGAPIFRGKRIALTGKFRHGPHDEIIAILRSYEADVVVDSLDCWCLVVGDLLEDSRGDLIRKAQWDHIPVVTETEFFTRFEIDADLEGGLSE